MSENGSCCTPGEKRCGCPEMPMAFQRVHSGSTDGMVRLKGGAFLMGTEDPVGFWADWNEHVRSIRPDAYTVTEIWEDAAGFVVEGGFSASMNYYGFAFPVKGFLVDGRMPPTDFADALAARTTVFKNGIVLPVDAPFTEHTALAIRAGKVLAIGDADSVMAQAGSDPAIVNLDGRVVMPGFIEPHMHFALMAGLGHLKDVGPFERPTFDDALVALRGIREEAVAAGPEEWVMGR